MITIKAEYRRAEARFSRLFDTVITVTRRYSDAAIREALTAAEVSEFYRLQDDLTDYDRRHAFADAVRSGDISPHS